MKFLKKMYLVIILNFIADLFKQTIITLYCGVLKLHHNIYIYIYIY